MLLSVKLENSALAMCEMFRLLNVNSRCSVTGSRLPDHCDFKHVQSSEDDSLLIQDSGIV